eukprot:TRINITY_DN1256_c0_g1_i3.p1 TRINITY_DN1256_c0_g1~~TRINITY_DN1256_c0_g1_i3.p1  ORF type:complete len:155 (+),score=39.95 TRINITY_DN1256_c0_g1_i3:43-507(+)
MRRSAQQGKSGGYGATGKKTFFFFFSSRRRHTRCREVSWARRCVQETDQNQVFLAGIKMHYLPTISNLPKSFDFGNVSMIRCGRKTYSILDDKNQIATRFNVIPGGKEDFETGWKLFSGEEVFKGKILEFESRYDFNAAIVDKQLVSHQITDIT